MILGFHERFVPFVLDGSKRYTIRDGSRWSHGMRADLFRHVRQENMELLFRAPIRLIEPIMIEIGRESRLIERISINGESLDASEMEAFAFADGFRKGIGVRNPYLREMASYYLNEKNSGTGRHHRQLVHWDYDRRFR